MKPLKELLKNSLPSSWFPAADNQYSNDERLEIHLDYLQTFTGFISEVLWILDMENRQFTFVSPAIIDLLGYTPAEFFQLDPNQYLPAQTASYIRTVTPERQQEFLENEESQSVYCDELQLVGRDGNSIWCEIRSACRRNPLTGRLEVIGEARDIRSSRNQRQAREQTEANLEAVLENTDDIILSIDREYRIITINKAGKKSFERILGRIPEPGNSIMDILPDFLKPLWTERYERAFRGERYWIKDEFLEGDVKYYSHVSFYPLTTTVNGEETVTAVSVYSKDITELIMTEEKLQKREEAYHGFIKLAQEGIARILFREPLDTSLDREAQIEHIKTNAYMAECNDAFAQLYDFSSASEVSQFFITDFLADDPEAVERLLSAIQGNGFQLNNFENQETVRSGIQKTFLYNLVSIRDASSVREFWISQIDITQRKEYEVQLGTSLKERTVLLQELHHRTKNNMQVIAAILNLQAQQSSNPETQSQLIAAENRINAISLVHKKLHQSGSLSFIRIDEYLKELVPQIISLLAASDSISVNIKTSPLENVIDLAVPLGLVLNELVCNSLHHGFAGSSGRIEISLQPAENDNWQIHYRDNGIGLESGFDPFTSSRLGFRTIITTMQNQLQGSIKFHEGSGFSCTLHFPVSRYKNRV
jgi:PAS domain S-box-containing protein